MILLAECIHYAVTVQSAVMLNVIMLTVVLLSGIMQSGIMLGVPIHRVVMAKCHYVYCCYA
jgi:hypothetical protein